MTERRTWPRRRPAVLAAVIVLAAGVCGWGAGRIAAPSLDRWEISRIDRHGTRPQPPALPTDPFPAGTRHAVPAS